MHLESLIIFGLATATIATTVASSKLFKSFRGWVAFRSEFFGELISCPYCLGHYPAAFFAGGAFSDRGLVWVVVGWLAITALSAIFSGLITFLFTSGEEG